nr:GGDEF domain-containing protein [uncultured Clostridium sp.]
MIEKDAYVLLEQIRSIILNKPAVGELEGDEPVYKELQETVTYLSRCMMEMNQFIQNLAEEDQIESLPVQDNFLAGMLKQLEVRERRLTEQAVRSKGFSSLLLAIINSLKDWVVVTEEKTGKILYTNNLVKKQFYNQKTGQFFCGEACELLQQLQSPSEIKDKHKYEFKCSKKRFFQIESHPLEWENTNAVIHLITDVTYQKETEAYLEVMAYKDELTGLNNRRCCISTIDEYIKAEFSFALCMVDLDGLKTINDQFGHLNGDKYLKCVSKELKESAQKGDFICRFGGDEFVILYRGLTEGEAAKRLDAINRNLSGIFEGYPMSVSYGIICIKKEMDLLPETALKIADEKMYRLKRLRKQKKKKS